MADTQDELLADGEDELVAVALEAARAAAGELASRFGSDHQGVRTKSGPTDLVSDADIAAERAVRNVLAARRPDDMVVGEEEGASGGAGELRWFIDPLDGTINYLFGIPVFAVSVACEDAAGALAGVVIDPLRDECFAATRSGVATLNGTPIRGPQRDELATAMVATGFAYNAAVRAGQAAVVARVLPVVRDIRRCGAAALDLCWTACGRFDAFYERSLNTWDVSAGALVCERAGVAVRWLAATGDEPAGVLAAAPGIVDELAALVGR
jgi:myo-inositol-1(or 4)-monophosphatase